MSSFSSQSIIIFLLLLENFLIYFPTSVFVGLLMVSLCLIFLNLLVMICLVVFGFGGGDVPVCFSEFYSRNKEALTSHFDVSSGFSEMKFYPACSISWMTFVSSLMT